MRQKDFTSDAIRHELLNYTSNKNFPHDELSDIGSMVYITGIADIEIASVRKSGVNFLVDGTATLETDTDIGDGDSLSGAYPMTFSYEFDSQGKIAKQHHRHIDTSSFFEGSDEDTYLIESASSEHLTVFENSIADIVNLFTGATNASRKCLYRLLFANVISALESYLSDFFISRIKTDKSLLRKLIKTTPTFRQQQVPFSDVFEVVETVEKRADTFLAGIVWHRLEHVRLLYERTLGIAFPQDMKALIEAIRVRHDLVHRNGRKIDGTHHEITETEIENSIKVARELIGHIERCWTEISSPF